MITLKNGLLISLALVLVAGCSNAGTETESKDSSVSTASEANYTEITWEDLMPEGEDEVLETLYLEFYEEFERKMKQSSMTLAEASKEETDIDNIDISAMIAEGSADDTMEQIGTFNVVEDLNGKRIRVPGYVVPFDFSADAEHKEFLLVPYFGACLHTPPPPPNQIIFIKADPAAKILDIEDPVWIEGTLSTGKFTSDLGNSAYELKLSKLEPYEY
jgi:hypothetical protein